MRRLAGMLLLLFSSVLQGQSTSAPAGIDPALWKRMLEIDSRVAKIHDMVADFEQSKFTALLKKPMVSKGTVRVISSSMLWDTTSPQPTLMRITEKEASIYYPKEKLMEVYPIVGQMGALAASPLPRLSMLEQHFGFSPASVKDLDPSADEATHLAVRLAPTDELVRQHVAQIRVLLDTAQGLMIRFEMTDPDGDRTVMTFSNVRVNTGLDEAQLTIHLPQDVKVVHPLDDLGPAPVGPGSRTSRQ